MHWIATTVNDGKPEHFINHSKNQPNMVPKVVVIDEKSRILFFTLRDVEKGEELLYDYKDQSKRAISARTSVLDS